jgi:hypothetical protein
MRFDCTSVAMSTNAPINDKCTVYVIKIGFVPMTLCAIYS